MTPGGAGGGAFRGAACFVSRAFAVARISVPTMKAAVAGMSIL
jgi:hypothetical protein